MTGFKALGFGSYRYSRDKKKSSRYRYAVQAVGLAAGVMSSLLSGCGGVRSARRDPRRLEVATPVSSGPVDALTISTTTNTTASGPNKKG